MGQITVTHTLAISLFLAPILAACSNPPQQSYTIGSAVRLSGVAAEAALIKDVDVKPKRLAGNPLDKEMRLLRAPMPAMPEEAIRAGIDDLVTVSILFNEAGNVETVVPKSYKDPGLLDAVLAAVRDWKIEAPVEACRRVKTRLQQYFRFEVQ